QGNTRKGSSTPLSETKCYLCSSTVNFKTMTYSVLRFLLLISVVLSFGNSCESECSILFSEVENLESEIDRINYLKSNPKESISCLISNIDTQDKGVVGHHNPYSSTFYPYFMDSYLGINRAYYVEMVLSTEKPNDEEIETNSMMGVILPVEDGQPVYRALDYEEIKEIKECYEDWWHQNEERDIHELRLEWSKGKRILDPHRFIWR
ncbi:hypothetical protein PQY73_02750, partial [Schleiferiaceae bacterium]|nr:hypothetical protein [Schleiferiaceae bacterium]